MNDPNGLFFYKGVYHLYFQYHPEDTVWGPMHWGHATSIDLVNWTEHDIALSPDEKGYIFSGCIVVDHKNTSGFGNNASTPIIALFTYHDVDAEAEGSNTYQSQALAYSLDDGFTFTKYADNPIIANPNLKDFRDPKVIWDKERGRWLMVLSIYDETLFYASENLKDWTHQSSFGKNLGAHGGVWECPDIFPIHIENTSETKWILLQSLNPGGANGGSGTQYFVGDFDGKMFAVDEAFSRNLEENGPAWLDYGKDNYASVSWSNIPEADGRRIIIGWMSNWLYAHKTPTSGWRGKMTFSRTLKLRKYDGQYDLHALPSEEIQEFTTKDFGISNLSIVTDYEVPLHETKKLNTSLLELKLSNLTLGNYRVTLSNENGEQLSFGIDTLKSQYYIDRRKSGLISFSDAFATSPSTAMVKSPLTKIKLVALIDHGSIELFWNDGQVVMTELFFNTQPYTKLTLFNSSKMVALIEKLSLSTIKPMLNDD